jgi:glutaredoxin 3
MKAVTIYTTMTCPFCYKAKRLMKKQGIEFNEISVDLNSTLRAEMAQKAGKTSVPQIWFDEEHIGGCDDLHTLHDANTLMERLA